MHVLRGCARVGHLLGLLQALRWLLYVCRAMPLLFFHRALPSATAGLVLWCAAGWGFADVVRCSGVTCVRKR